MQHRLDFFTLPMDCFIRLNQQLNDACSGLKTAFG
jgi:hypothetical protein